MIREGTVQKIYTGYGMRYEVPELYE